MTETRDDLRSLDEWRPIHEEGRSDGSPDCPPDEVLAALVTGELRGEERLRYADHIVACRRCAATYRTLRELDGEAGRQRERRRIGGRLAWALAAAASVLLVAWLLGPARHLLMDSRGSTASPETVRSVEGEDRVVPPADAVLQEAPHELAWTGRAGASSYRVRLFDATAAPLWERSGILRPRIELPESARSRLAAGASYFWVVEIEGPPAGERLGPYWFRVAGSK